MNMPKFIKYPIQLYVNGNEFKNLLFPYKTVFCSKEINLKIQACLWTAPAVKPSVICEHLTRHTNEHN